MSPAYAIDFERGNIGLWILFVCGAVVMLASSRPEPGLFKQGWKRVSRFLLARILVGVLIAAPVVAFLATWQRIVLPYFVSLRLDENHLVMGFRWPTPDLLIPLNDVNAISVVRERNILGSTYRVRVVTTSSAFWSFGYSRLRDDECQALDRMRELARIAYPTQPAARPGP